MTLPLLTGTDVHIWHFGLDEEVNADSLSNDELQRADRLKIPLVRRRFIAARVHLRWILSQYVTVPPAQLIFQYTASGKPFLPHNIEFNLTHSENHALLAVARSPVGIDIERLRPIDGLDYIVNSTFTPDERQAIATIENPIDKIRAFFRCWTCKEAYMKAKGEGFKIAATFSVSVDAHPRLLHDQTWKFAELPLPSEYIGVICVPSDHKKIIILQTENKFPTCEITL
jgi:4'-phosphopantetheinyl transferase